MQWELLLHWQQHLPGRNGLQEAVGQVYKQQQHKAAETFTESVYGDDAGAACGTAQRLQN
jgi:hypothetical protein